MGGSKTINWRVALTPKERRRIAHRGPIDCLASGASTEDVIPCHGCTCWLITAFRHEHREKIHLRRMDKLRAQHGDTADGVPCTLFATADNKAGGRDGLLEMLRRKHPERDPRNLPPKDDAA